MKKILILSFILFLGIFTYAQDTVYTEPDFDAWPFSDWTAVSGADGNNWNNLRYASVVGDSAQDEVLVAPGVILSGATTAFRITYDYWTVGMSADFTLSVLEFNGRRDGAVGDIDWDTDATNVWNSVANHVWTGDDWYKVNQRTIPVGGVATDTLTIAFRAESQVTGNALPHDRSWGIDNVLVEQDTNTAHGPGAVDDPWKVLINMKFASGIANGWVTVNGADADTHWGVTNLNGTEHDTGDDQLESLVSDLFYLPDNAMSNFNLDFDYHIKNQGGAGSGTRIFIINQNDDTLDVDGIGTKFFDVSYNAFPATNESIFRSISLNRFKDDTIKVAFEFSTTTAAVSDFFLESLILEQVFDDGTINADADITVGAGQVLVWPTNDYEGDYKEGFWQVQPEGWSRTSKTGAHWKRESGAANTVNPGKTTAVSPATHDYYAYIDTVGSKGAAINESLTSELIPLNVPSQGADYEFSFEWATEAHLNAGEDTNPLFGAAARYNFADIAVMYRLDGGNWDTVWTEADEAVLDATTLTSSDGYRNAWTGFNNYLNPANANKWYKTVIPITIATTNNDIEFKITYKATNGAEAGAFMIDNMYLLETERVEFEVEAMTSQSVTDDYVIDYYTIPISQIENPAELSLQVTNNGTTGITDDPIVASVTDGSGTNVYGVELVSDADFGTTFPVTKRIVIDDDITNHYQQEGGLNLEAGQTYTYSYSATLNGTTYSDSKTFEVGTDLYRKHNGGSTGTLTLSDDSTGSVGSIFEFKRSDVVDEVTFYLNSYTAGSEGYMTIIKLENPTDTKGEEVVYTSPRTLLTNTLKFNAHEVTLDTGFYAFMLHQTDKNNIVLLTNNIFEGEVVRGDVDSLYSWDTENFNIRMDVSVKPNVDPEVITEFPSNKVNVVAGDSTINIMLLAQDENGNPLTWVTDKAQILDPAWLGDWMEITSNVDTMFIKGVPADKHLGKVEVTATVQDDRNGEGTYTFVVEVVSELAYFEPDYDADFRLWSQRDDVMDDSGNAPTAWTRSAGDARINGTSSYDQYEILLSAPIMLPAASKAVGVEYAVEFNWQVGNFDFFCKGTDVLGSKDATTGGNFADVTLEIHDGEKWIKLWKEDDPELVANTTAGVQAGALWGYDNGDHDSKIDISEYAGKLVYFRFVYEGKNAVAGSNMFYLWDFEVNANQEIDLTTFFRPKYFNVPGQLVDTAKGIEVEYYIVNKGQRIPEGSTYDIEIPELGIFNNYPLTEAMFATSDSVVETISFDPILGSYQGYNFTIRLNVDDLTPSTPGQANMTKTINVTNNRLSVNEFVAGNVTGRSGGISVKSVGVGNGLGMKFAVMQPDVLEQVNLSFFDDLGNGSEQYSISIIKLDSATATTGKPIVTIDDRFGVDLMTGSFGAQFYQYIDPTEDNDINDVVKLDSGYYVLLVNQLDDNQQIELTTARQAYDPAGYVRGNEKGFYNEPGDKFFLDIAIILEQNDAPVFSSKNPPSVTVPGTNNDETIYQGQKFERLIVATDDNVWGDITISDVSLPYWMELKQSDEGIVTVEGEASDANPGTYEVVLNATDGWADSDGSFVVTVKENQAPVFTSTPPTMAIVGAPFVYEATGEDKLGEIVEIQLEGGDTAWFELSGAGTDALTLSGTPTAADLGSNVVKLSIKDSYGNIAHQTFDVFVYENIAPMFVSSSKDTVFVKQGLAYEYLIVTDDANGTDGLEISADTIDGSWMKFMVNADNNARAMLYGTPMELDTVTVNLTVTDPSQASDIQTVTVISVSNMAPEFVNDTTKTAQEDELFVQELLVEDAEMDVVTFSVKSLPNWCTFTVTGKYTAIVQGIPVNGSEGDDMIAIQVFDGENSDVFKNKVELTMVDDAPIFKTTEIEAAQTGVGYEALIEAEDEEGAKLSFSGNIPAWLTLTTEGDVAKLTGTPLTAGVFTFDLAVSDGNSTTFNTYEVSVSGATAINSNESVFELYPNPASSDLTIVSEAGAQIYIYSVAGELVKVINSADEKQVIDVTGLQGAFIAKVVTTKDVRTKGFTVE